MHPLISVDALEEIDGRVVVCDLRWDLTDRTKGRETYERGHIPGARFVDLDTDLADPPGSRGRHPLPDVSVFAAALGDLGIAPGSHVVAYDDAGGRIAARMWWMLRSIGHESVQVLDGGYPAWVAAGKDVERGTVIPSPVEYPTPAGFTGVVGHDDLLGRNLIDARVGERYRGEIEPIDPKAGHIPGAINIDTARNLDQSGRFLPPEALREIYTAVSDGAVVSCGSGVHACHDALAMEIAGLPAPDLYVGSFSEWSRLDLPVETGPRP